MTDRRLILQNGYEASRVDFVGAFLRLWVSFNTWYNSQISDASEPSEQRRVLRAGSRNKMKIPYYLEMDNLNNPNFNDNAKHVIETVEAMSVFEYPDGHGNLNRSMNDTTGFKYRLICNRSNVHTEFLNSCLADDNLSDWCHGIVSFNINSRKDKLFKTLYLGYKRNRATAQNIVKPFDAVDHIPNFLRSIGIRQFGCILYFNLNTPTNTSAPIVSFEDVFGASFIRFMSRANSYNSVSAVRRKFSRVGRSGRIYRWVESRNHEILQRELLLLYKFRSSIVHGERDPKSDSVQKLARLAYDALDDLMAPLFV